MNQLLEHIPSDEQRVVVTGMGCVTPLGNEVDAMFNAVVGGQDAMAPLPPDVLEKYSSLRVKVGAPITGFDIQQDTLLVGDNKDRKEIERDVDRSAQFSLWSIARALRDAGLLSDTSPREIDWNQADRKRVGIIMGTGVGGTNKVADARERLLVGRKLSVGAIMQILPERVATEASMKFKARGPVNTVVAACATGNVAIANAAMVLQAGRADVMIAGGTEAQLSGEGLGLFDAMTALDFTDDPASASRPFHNAAAGFVMGEGAGALVLETLAHARRRCAIPLAELVGYGHTSDADHKTMANGIGGREALELTLENISMRRAREAGIYVNAHATGTAGDAKELSAMDDIIGASNVAGISSTKGALGHLLGAAGAVEAIITIEAVRRGIIPPSLKVSPDTVIADAAKWAVCYDRAAEHPLALGINSSFGFGGINAITAWQPL